MKTNKPDKFKLHEGGKDEFESTDEFMNKVEEIRKDFTRNIRRNFQMKQIG